MRIERIELFHVRTPLLRPWRTAYGEDAAVESLLVRMESGGLAAWGETTPLAAPCYSPEWAGGAFAVLRNWLAPALVGRDVNSGAQLQALLAPYKGNPFAKAGLDVAWWSLEALRRGVPLYRLLGATRSAALVGADFGVGDSIDELLREVEQALLAGFRRVKLKFRPGWDLPMLSAVRREFPDATIHIDCNAGYRLTHLDLFRRLDEFGLAMIEQPLGHDDLVDHARLQAAIATPVCLDESASSTEKVRQAIELGSCRYVNVKPGRVGGLTPAVEIHEACRAAGIGLWVGGMLESAVGARIAAALAMLDGFSYPADLFPSRRFYARDLGRPEVELSLGPSGAMQISPLEAPGIGTEPDSELLGRWTVDRAVVREAGRRGRL